MKRLRLSKGQSKGIDQIKVERKTVSGWYGRTLCAVQMSLALQKNTMSAASFCSSSHGPTGSFSPLEHAPHDSLPLTPPLYTVTPVSSLNSSYHFCLWVSLSLEMWWTNCPHPQYPFLLCIPPFKKKDYAASNGKLFSVFPQLNF